MTFRSAHRTFRIDVVSEVSHEVQRATNREGRYEISGR